tara:strand:+ start:3383 stop:3517 length:135 start_codon:yes stop_codon:yes gene_type:complete
MYYNYNNITGKVCQVIIFIVIVLFVENDPFLGVFDYFFIFGLFD